MFQMRKNRQSYNNAVNIHCVSYIKKTINSPGSRNVYKRSHKKSFKHFNDVIKKNTTANIKNTKINKQTDEYTQDTRHFNKP